MEKGNIKWFKNDKGYGFISQPNKLGKDIFVHYSSIEPERKGFKSLEEGDEVEFEFEEGPKGPQATYVRKIS